MRAPGGPKYQMAFLPSREPITLEDIPSDFGKIASGAAFPINGLSEVCAGKCPMDQADGDKNKNISKRIKRMMS